jgi:hypothetical protein
MPNLSPTCFSTLRDEHSMQAYFSLHDELSYWAVSLCFMA